VSENAIMAEHRTMVTENRHSVKEQAIIWYPADFRHADARLSQIT